MQSEAERRYRDDAEFHAAVDMLRHMAMKHGFTPYELKQIAFTAALINELHSARTFRIPIPATCDSWQPFAQSTPGEIAEQVECARCHGTREEHRR